MKKYFFLTLLMSGQAFAVNGLQAGDNFSGRGSNQGALCSITVESSDGDSLVISGNLGGQQFESLEFSRFVNSNYGGQQVIEASNYGERNGVYSKDFRILLFPNGDIARLEVDYKRHNVRTSQNACTEFERE